MEVNQDNFRLNQLNFDCLGAILEQLKTADLIKLCLIDATLANAVAERIVRKRTIHFSEWNQIWSTEQIFDTFGPWIKSMSIEEHNICRKASNRKALQYFLELLVKNCDAHWIKALSLRFSNGELNPQLLNAAKPFFTQLRKLHFSSFGHRKGSGIDQLLTTIIDAADKLDSIVLENVNAKDTHFKQELALKTFIWVNENTPNDTLCEKIVQHSPHLEQFIDRQFAVPEQYLQENLNRYSYLAAAEKLKFARITTYMRSGQDLINFFAEAATKNTLKFLSIAFLDNAWLKINNNAEDREHFDDRYPHFTSLTKLEIINNSSCMYWGQIFISFIFGLVNLREICISGNEAINPVQMTSIARAPPNLEILRINRVLTTNLHIALSVIGRIRTTPLTVIINRQQESQLIGRYFSDRIKFIVE
jgi:hypothetical protein